MSPGGGVGYMGDRGEGGFNPDVSKYPYHVPTVREQLAGSVADIDPDSLSRDEVENLTAIGVLSNPLTQRTWYEDEYDRDRTPAERTAEWSLTPEEASGHSLMNNGTDSDPPSEQEQRERLHEEAGVLTPAFVKGPDADDTVFPSKSRKG
jgi:hypothetical protein